MDAACNAVQESEGKTAVKDQEAANFSSNPEDREDQNDNVDVSASPDYEDNNHITDGDKESSAREVAIQANDYEIERMASMLPSRKRYIPLKFSDYRIFAGGTSVEEKEDEEEEEEDETFDPEKSKAKKATKTASGRGRGRPRKNAALAEDSAASDDRKQDGPERKNIITKVPAGFKCGMCGRIFSLRGNAKAHMITHTDERPFACDFEGCGKKLRTKESLRRHQLSHLGIKMFECSECKKKFSCNASLQEHMARHTGAKPLSCTICGRKFRQVAVLKRHITTHSNEKPFACGVCGKRFAMRVYVQSHMKTHTGERPFTCDTCNKSFAHASDLNRHKITHTGNKPYACSVCSMRYSDASSRRRHEREHQSKQQYMCHLCNQHFTRAGQLRNHLMREHSGESETLYEVKVVEKSSQDPWPAVSSNSGQPRLVSMLQNMPTNIVVQQMETVGQGGQSSDNLTDIIPSSQTVQGLMGTPQLTQSLTDSKENAESGAQEENTKSISVAELPTSLDDLASLQPGCTYRIIGHNDGGQIYELQLEDGSSIPFEELANRVSLGDSQFQGKDAPLTVIHQEDNMFTVIQQPAHGTNNTVQQQTEQIPHSSLQWPVDSHTSQSLQTAQIDLHVEQGMSELRDENPKDDVTSVQAEQIIQLVESSSVVELDPAEGPSNISGSKEAVDHMKTEENTYIPEIKVDHWQLSVPKTETDDTPDYVYDPDLNSQDYYNWLSSFTEECKLLSMPLDKEMFQKISHVQKTLSDFMALPSGVITDKNNFKVLMSITHDLSDITGRHLSYMLQNLS